MNIEEIKSAKKELEKQITQKLMDFTKTSGAMITELTVGIDSVKDCNADIIHTNYRVYITISL